MISSSKNISTFAVEGGSLTTTQDWLDDAAQALNQELADLKGGVDTYNALVAKMNAGEITVSNAIDAEPETTIKVDYQGNIK